MAASFVPRRINSGTFVTAHSLAELKVRIRDARVVLPVCPLGTPAEEIAALGPWVLPPLYREAMRGDLQARMVQQICRCFPYLEGSRARATWKGAIDVVELPATRRPAPEMRPRAIAFSVDTAVEQHGPHLPLATDQIQSYAVLEKLAAEFDGFLIAPPVDYGQLTWGLPFGCSIDLTAPLIEEYATGYANAVVDWCEPAAMYVVDVHGSIIHRTAVQRGLAASRCRRHAFRWLYDPLVQFGPERGDVHAGGVETAIVETVSRDLVDPRWWPDRREELARGQMTASRAVELSADMAEFVRVVESGSPNGIIGEIRNYAELDGRDLLERMVAVARTDVEALIRQSRAE